HVKDRIMPSTAAVLNRRFLVGSLGALAAMSGVAGAHAQTPTASLASWNDGPARQAISDFVRATIDRASSAYVPPEDRIATFDQDGTLWVEHPLYCQAMFALYRVRSLAPQHSSWKSQQPFKTVLSGDPAKIAHLTEKD